ncbi:F-box/WD repeat-containing protein 11 isoform X2 [Eurytemora carolleeae]|uniref:F-box/WD repeat-containing protein 11 isoform X2 n=1 Tax=Eurytemora carolleeae TaxID=1294199 RepID=UPI000C75E93E|nr:F-box/WD repeat-containing protein 11 isoform X2 [Eurytemora carolleeae]|eukprot:XP_023349825.1 F-box/WD repeat-containing protein 11-like isoform X2 [Eurytemora affinis]
MWSASFDCTVRLWSSTEDWSCIAVLSGHTHPVRALVLTQGYIVSGDYRGFIMIWDIKDVFTEITKFQIQQKKHKKQESSLFRMRGGRLVQDSAGIAEVLQHSSLLEHDHHVTCLQANPAYLISGSRDKTIVIYSFLPDKEKRKKSRNGRTSYFDSLNKY